MVTISPTAVAAITSARRAAQMRIEQQDLAIETYTTGLANCRRRRAEAVAELEALDRDLAELRPTPLSVTSPRKA